MCFKELTYTANHTLILKAWNQMRLFLSAPGSTDRFHVEWILMRQWERDRKGDMSLDTQKRQKKSDSVVLKMNVIFL